MEHRLAIISIGITVIVGIIGVSATVLLLPNNEPQAVIKSYVGTEVEIDKEAIFSAEGSRDSGGEIVSYKWDFGDNKKDEGFEVSHIYNNLGDKDVTLTVTDNDNNKDVDIFTISVVDEIKPPTQLSAKITGPKSVKINTLVTFTADESQKPQDGYIENYQWYIDGEKINEQSFLEYTFENKGTYQIDLVVFDNENQASKDTVSVAVSEFIEPTCKSNEILENGICRIKTPPEIPTFVHRTTFPNIPKPIASSDDGYFNKAYGIALDSHNNIFVADDNNNRIQKFDSEGNPLEAWGGAGSGAIQFNHPTGVMVSDSDYLYVADQYNYRLQVLTLDGIFVEFIPDPEASDPRKNIQFSWPTFTVQDKEGFIYATNHGSGKVIKLTSDGIYEKEWNIISGKDTLQATMGIALSGNNLYVTERGGDRVVQYDLQGNYLHSWGGKGTGNSQFNSIGGIAVDPSGFVYVADFGNNRITLFDSEGKFVDKIGKRGTDSGQFYGPIGIAFDESGNMYVTEYWNHRVQIFDRK